MRKITEIHLHHTEKPCKADFNGKNHSDLILSMARYHVLKRGFSEYAYHFTVFPDGVVLQGRPIEKAPASIAGRNKEAVAVALLGNFDLEQLEAVQRKSLINLIINLLDQYSIKPENIVFHREHSKKTCPGKNIEKKELIEWLKKE